MLSFRDTVRETEAMDFDFSLILVYIPDYWLQLVAQYKSNMYRKYWADE